MTSERPETRYAKAGDVFIGYQTLGDGPIDVVFFPNWFSNIEMFWELPRLENWFRRIASFAGKAINSAILNPLMYP